MSDSLWEYISKETKRGISRSRPRSDHHADTAGVVARAAGNAVARSTKQYLPRGQAKTLSGWSGRASHGESESFFSVDGVTLSFDGVTNSIEYNVKVRQYRKLAPMDPKILGSIKL